MHRIGAYMPSLFFVVVTKTLYLRPIVVRVVWYVTRSDVPFVFFYIFTNWCGNQLGMCSASARYSADTRIHSSSRVPLIRRVQSPRRTSCAVTHSRTERWTVTHKTESNGVAARFLLGPCLKNHVCSCRPYIVVHIFLSNIRASHAHASELLYLVEHFCFQLYINTDH